MSRTSSDHHGNTPWNGGGAGTVVGVGTGSDDAGRRPWVVGVSGASGTPYAASVLRGLLAVEAPIDLIVSRAARLTLLDETGVSWRDGAWRECLTAWLTSPTALSRLGPDEPSLGTPTTLTAASPPPRDRDARDRDARDRDARDRDARDRGGGHEGRDGHRRAGGVPGHRWWGWERVRDAVERLVRHHGPADLAAAPSSGSYQTAGMIVVPASTACVAGIALGLSKDLLQRAADVTLKERRRLVVVPREMPYTRSTLRHMLDLHDAGAVVAAASPGFYAGATDAQALVDFVAGRVLDAAGVPNDLFRRWTGDLGAARSG